MRADLKRLKRETESGRAVGEDSAAGPAASAQSAASASSGSAPPGGAISAGSISSGSSPAAASSSSVLIAEARRHKAVRFATGAAVLALVIAAVFGAYKLLSKNTPAIDTRNISIRPLTDHGEVVNCAGISRDGRLVAYDRREGNGSLRVKQVITGSEVTVVPPQTGSFWGATFSPDGNYLYYSHEDPTNSSNSNLYSVPALGGASRQIVSDVEGGTAFSPDGEHILYARTIQDKAEAQLLIGKADGGGENIVLRRQSGTGGFFTDPSWSALGLIAVGVEQLGTKNIFSSILVLTPQGTLVKSFSLPMLVVDSLAWLPDASGLFFIGAEKSTGLRRQIWFQPYPSGDPFKVTNDLSRYSSLSITADGKSLAAIQQRKQATIYVGDSPVVLNDKIDWKLNPISTQEATGYSLSWTAAGKLLQLDSANHPFATTADGADRMPLLQNDQLAQHAVACGPGDIVILPIVSEDNAQRIQRLNLATGELKQLGFGKLEHTPSCTPDGKWVVYGEADSVQHIFKVSVDGGTPVELARGRVYWAVVSPDGASIAYVRYEGQGTSAKRKFVVQKLDGGALTQEIDLPSTYDWSELGWTPDGRALTYVHSNTGTAQNLYVQPLAGGAPFQLTHFDSEPSRVAAYAWSRDGKKLAITRSRYNDTDVVLFSGFR
jgi:Tol biopolymer transport system component